jgi:ribonuclease D
LREQGMLEVAMKLPENKAKLFQLESITPKEARIHTDTLLELVQNALNTAAVDCPPKVQRLTDFNDYKKALSTLKDVCEGLAQKHHTRVEVLASKKQLNQWLKWCWFEIDELDSVQLQPDIVSGWRRTIFAQDLARLFKPEGGTFNALRSL